MRTRIAALALVCAGAVGMTIGVYLTAGLGIALLVGSALCMLAGLDLGRDA